jgi:hypothetical protein
LFTTLLNIKLNKLVYKEIIVVIFTIFIDINIDNLNNFRCLKSNIKTLTSSDIRVLILFGFFFAKGVL